MAALAVAVLTLFLGNGPASAASSTLYVDRSDPNCSDEGQGTAARPFCTIGTAASEVVAGQTVQVAAGTYPEDVQITASHSGTSSQPVVFTAAPGATVTLSGQANGFTISGASWITVTGFAVTNTTDYGMLVSNSSHITLSNNHVSHAGQPVSGQNRAGIRLSNVADSLVSGNTSDHNSDHGITVTGGSTRNEVKGNLTFSNAEGFQRVATGIRLFSAPGNTVDGNVTHDNEDSGIECFSGSNNTLLYNNVSYNNGDHGIDNFQATGQRIIANTVYRNLTAGINIESTSTGATIANNISIDNGINSPRTKSDIRVESGSTSGTSMDSDLVYITTSDPLLIWNSTSYKTLSSFQSATGQEAHGIQGDARWSDPATGDFHLTASSPAIDAANSGASGQPGADQEGNSRVDDPATPNTGLGPRSYDDRGAYEFQPPDAPPAAALEIFGAGSPTITADASGSTDNDATPIASYTFDFGDGSRVVGPQSEATATHTYVAAGTYTVTVTVTDTAGLSSTASAMVDIAPSDSPPSSSLSVNPSSGFAPLTVTADASGSTDTDATPISSYTFDFGDGSRVVGPQSGATATHVYANAGTYTVTVTVTDTGGLSSAASATVEVMPPSRIVVVKDAIPDDPQDFDFTAGGGLSPTSFQLDDDSDATLSNTRTFENVTPRTGYSVSETIPAGWEQTAATCDDGSPPSNITTSAGETVTCTFTNSKTYSVPIGASPFRASLVPAFTPCTNLQNATHAGPLSGSACSPPIPSSSLVAVGSQAVAFARMIVLSSGQCAPFDSTHCYPDVTIRFDLTDVRSGNSSGPDYETASSQDLTGVATLPSGSPGDTLQITDRQNQLVSDPSGPYDKSGTAVPFKFPVPIGCTATADPATGSVCDAVTTANTLVPGSAVAGSRAIWELGQLQVLDLGINGVPDGDDKVFETEGVFVP